MSFTSEIILDLQRWNEDTQRILRIHGHAEFFFIFVSLICLLQKKIMWAQKGLPISLMTIILHRTKAVISSITPLYIVKREIKYKKTHPVHRMIYPKQDSELFINKSHVILHALQKLQYIYKFQWDFPPLSPSFSLYYTHHNSLFSLTLV